MDPISRNILFGAPTGKPLFDDYGAFGVPIDSNCTLTHHFSNYDDANGNLNGVGSALIKRPGIDYEGSMLIVSDRSMDDRNLYEITPDTNDWGTVTNSSQITYNFATYQDLGSDNSSQTETIGTAFFTDTTGTHCVGRGFSTQINTNTSRSNYLYKCGIVPDGDASFQRSFFNFSAQHRLASAISSGENMFAASGYDELGIYSSGEGSLLLCKSLDDDNSPLFGGSNSIFSIHDGSSQDTGFNVDRANFLGAVRNSDGKIDHWYMVRYNRASGSGSDGYKILKVRVTDGGSSPSLQFTGQHHFLNSQSQVGFPMPGNSIYPHGMAHWGEGSGKTNQVSNYIVAYLDLSNVSSNTSATIISFGSDDPRALSQIGYQGGKLLLAYVVGTTLKIREYTPGSTSLGTTIKSVSIGNSSNSATGIWPVPNTNRIIIGHAGGMTLVSLTP